MEEKGLKVTTRLLTIIESHWDGSIFRYCFGFSIYSELHSEMKEDKSRFPGKWPPTPSLSQDFALSEKYVFMLT